MDRTDWKIGFQRDKGGRLLDCHERRQHERIADFFSSRTTVRNRANGCDSQRVDLRFPWSVTEHRKIFVFDCAGNTSVFRCKKEGPEKQHNKDIIVLAVFSGLTFLPLSGVRLFRVASPTKTQHGQWDLLESLRDTGLIVDNC